MTTPAIYSDLFQRLELDRVRYVAISGVAVVLHGHLRPIVDLDLVIDPTPDHARQAMSTLTASGFVPSIPLPLELLTVLRMFDHRNREVDVFVKYHIPFNELWSESRQVQVGDTCVRVASLEHLLRAKRINGRPHDLQDIQGLHALAKHRGPDRISDA